MKFLSFSPSLQKICSSFSIGIYNNNKQHITYYRCARLSPLSRAVTLSGLISRTSGFGVLQAYISMKTYSKCVTCCSSAFKVIVSRLIFKFIELIILAILLTSLEPNQPRAFRAWLPANPLQRNISENPFLSMCKRGLFTSKHFFLLLSTSIKQVNN